MIEFGRLVKNRWVAVDDAPAPRCGVKRGPRSQTRCEQYPGHEGEHIGRSPSGRWFVWENKEKV